MMWHTHAMLGASSVGLVMPLVSTDDPSMVAVLMTFAVAGAMVPDLDAAESKIMHIRVGGIKPLVTVAIAINRELGHRGLLHSLRGWLIWTLVITPLTAWIGWLPAMALSLGYASHLAGDACTRTGIPLLYPKRKNFYLLPRKIHVVTGSEYEELFFVAFALLIVCLLMAHLSGHTL